MCELAVNRPFKGIASFTRIMHSLTNQPVVIDNASPGFLLSAPVLIFAIYLRAPERSKLVSQARSSQNAIFQTCMHSSELECYESLIAIICSALGVPSTKRS